MTYEKLVKIIIISGIVTFIFMLSWLNNEAFMTMNRNRRPEQLKSFLDKIKMLVYKASFSNKLLYEFYITLLLILYVTVGHLLVTLAIFIPRFVTISFRCLYYIFPFKAITWDEYKWLHDIPNNKNEVVEQTDQPATTDNKNEVVEQPDPPAMPSEQV